MQKKYRVFKSWFFSNLLTAVLVGSSIFITSAAAYKLSGVIPAMNQKKVVQTVAQGRAAEDVGGDFSIRDGESATTQEALESSENSESGSAALSGNNANPAATPASVAVNRTPAANIPPSAVPIVNNNPTTALANPPVISTAASTSSSRCIITLFGSQYDVTSLRRSHPGGDVFVCGNDQSALYQSAHGTNLNRMQQYLVSATPAVNPVVPIPTVSVNTTSNNTNNNIASATPLPANSNACIITLFGSQYDVTSLRSSHPGGDVFVCGTDQSALYQSAHGTSVSRMRPYLVASITGSNNSSGSGTAGTTTPAVNTSRRHEREHEEEDELEDDD